jgi:uncharacterized protein YlzI (FlbEa/FlbD family)
MIRLTRLRNPNPLYINADHIERLDSNHETTVHLSNGGEYVVVESADMIVRLINEQRAGLLALAMRLEHDLPRTASAAQFFADEDSREDAVTVAHERQAEGRDVEGRDVEGRGVEGRGVGGVDDAEWKPAGGSSAADTENDGS